MQLAQKVDKNALQLTFSHGKVGQPGDPEASIGVASCGSCCQEFCQITYQEASCVWCMLAQPSHHLFIESKEC